MKVNYLDRYVQEYKLFLARTTGSICLEFGSVTKQLILALILVDRFCLLNP